MYWKFPMILIQHSVNSDWLFNTQSRILQVDWLILENNEKATLKVVSSHYWPLKFVLAGWLHHAHDIWKPRTRIWHSYYHTQYSNEWKKTLSRLHLDRYWHHNKLAALKWTLVPEIISKMQHPFPSWPLRAVNSYITGTMLYLFVFRIVWLIMCWLQLITHYKNRKIDHHVFSDIDDIYIYIYI